MSRNCDEHPETAATAFCVKCGKAMCAECALKFLGRPICAMCMEEQREALENQRAEQQRLDPLRDGAASVPGWETPGAAKRKSAGLITEKELRRVAALIVDFAIIAGAAFPFTMLLNLVTKLVFPEVAGFGYRLSGYLSALLLSSVYFVVCHWRWGKTVGKHLFRLKVVHKSGREGISLWQSSWRWTGFFAAAIWSFIGIMIFRKTLLLVKMTGGKLPMLSGQAFMLMSLAAAVILSLGLLMTFVGRRKRGFHDLLGETIVVIESRDARGLERRAESGGEDREI